MLYFNKKAGLVIFYKTNGNMGAGDMVQCKIRVLVLLALVENQRSVYSTRAT